MAAASGGKRGLAFFRVVINEKQTKSFAVVVSTEKITTFQEVLAEHCKDLPVAADRWKVGGFQNASCQGGAMDVNDLSFGVTDFVDWYYIHVVPILLTVHVLVC